MIYPAYNHIADSTPKHYIGPYIILRKVPIGGFKELQEVKLPRTVKMSKRIDGRVVWTNQALVIKENKL